MSKENYKYKNMYWSMQNKRNALEEEVSKLERKLIGYDSLLKENTRLQKELDISDNIEGLEDIESIQKDNIELQKKVDIYEQKILYGTVKTIVRDEFGYISNDKYGDIYFHVTGYVNGFLHHHFKGRDVLFNLSITPKGLRAINVQMV